MTSLEDQVSLIEEEDIIEDDFCFNFDKFDQEDNIELLEDPDDKALEDPVSLIAKIAEANRTVKVFKTMCTPKKMKLLSESSLDDALDWHLEEGCAYHCISFGDVDSLTYLRHIVRQQHIEYVMLSTWCMAMEDAKEIASWVDRGFVDHVDFYVGEIFKNGYRGVRDAIELIASSCGGRVARFRNHSKIMAGFGDKFAFVIESSANVNTNPRTEQTCITIDRGLALFYKEFFDGINSFDGGFEDWTPYQLEEACSDESSAN